MTVITITSPPFPAQPALFVPSGRRNFFGRGFFACLKNSQQHDVLVLLLISCFIFHPFLPDCKTSFFRIFYIFLLLYILFLFFIFYFSIFYLPCRKEWVKGFNSSLVIYFLCVVSEPRRPPDWALLWSGHAHLGLVQGGRCGHLGKEGLLIHADLCQKQRVARPTTLNSAEDFIANFPSVLSTVHVLLVILNNKLANRSTV